MKKSSTFRNRALAVLAVLALGACNRDWDTSRAALGEAGSTATATAQNAMGRSPAAAGQGLPMLQVGAAGARAAFAALPDRGDLVGYPQDRVVRREGAYTWHRADVSEAHALRAIIDGELRITAPDGQLLAFEYERHVEHPTGDWTWIGRLRDAPPGRQAILTFGADAVFGTIAQSAAAPLRLNMRDGASWLVETDLALLAGVEERVLHPDSPDFLLPPVYMGNLSGPKASGDTVSSSGSVEMSSSTSTSTTTVVDVLVGYTTGFATAQGGDSQARTRINFLIEVGNQAYVNSQINARVRLVHAMQVSYPDATENADTLEKLTGYVSGEGKTTPDPAFSALRNARETYGADLVTLVRKFTDPENDGCGIAWLIGGELTTITQGYEYFGYSVVSDGIDQGDDGKNYTCRLETMVHEFGHNMGSAHDVETAKGDDGILDHPDDYGRYTYSFGYKTGPGSGDFYTVMAYGDRRDSPPYQTSYRVFSNPNITFCGGFACGTSSADNARSLTQTIPIIAGFRSTVVQDSAPPSLYTIARNGGSGRTEIHILAGSSGYQSFSQNYATALHQTGSDASWAFLAGDYNKDGVRDLYSIAKMGGSGQTEVHVLDGSSGFSLFSAHIATALHGTGNDNGWQFKLGDFDRDGTLDLYAINRNGGSGATEVHVLNGANNFQSFLAHIGTALHATGNGYEWAFELGDYNRDGSLDVFVIAKSGGSGTTELHILDGATRFQSFLLHRATALHPTPADNSWEFKLGDYNLDGSLDVYAISKQGGSGTTELHVLSGSSGYTSFIAHIATALHRTGNDESWEFEFGPGT